MEKDSFLRLKDFKKVKNIVGFLLSLALATVFFFSAIGKLFSYASFEQFTWTFMDMGFPNIEMAAAFARLFIGAELMLGCFLLLHLFLKEFTLPAVLIFLIILTSYLAFSVLKHGNTGDCGCFGDAYKMKPVAAIVKNLVMLATSFLLLKIYPAKIFKRTEILTMVLCFATFVLPFIVHPFGQDRMPQAVHQPIHLDPLYNSKNPQNIPPEIDLREGKHIVAFLSLTCPHCRKAAYELQIIFKQRPEFPIFMVLNGHPNHLKDFFDDTHADKVPHTLFAGGDEFVFMAGPGVPAIYWVNNGTIERTSNYYQLDPDVMESWLRAN
jgi:uncharacterized membrane protein YphA (DoxX/SURF4 family)